MLNRPTLLERFSRFGAAVGAAVALAAATAAVMLVPAIVTAAPADSAAATNRFVPVAPTRLLDTRLVVCGGSPCGKPGDDGVIELPVTGRGNVAVGATAVVLNVTATDTTGPGFVTAYPAGATRPVASNLNPEVPGQSIPNLVTVPLGANGAVDLYTKSSTHVVADVFGYYVAASSARDGRYVPVGPGRAFDSREGAGAIGLGEIVRVSLGQFVPSDATAAVLNVTVDQARAPGFWTVFPAGGAQPDTSNLNITEVGQTIANQVIVPVNDAAVDVFAQTGGHLIVDVAGYFTGASAPLSTSGLFVPVPVPTRFLDSRDAVLNPLGHAAKPAAGWTVEVGIAGRSGIPDAVSAVVMNTTITASKDAGFVTAYPAGRPRPNASNLNVIRGRQTIANHTISPVGRRGVALYTQRGGHLVADVTGWYTGTPLESTAPVPFNSYAPSTLPARMTIPRLGLDRALYDGIDEATLAAGPGHWPGTARPGEFGNMAIFGHRVSHDHPFLYLPDLQPGDDIFVTTDNTIYHYVVQGAVVVGADDTSIIDPVAGGQATLTLVACHPPGSITYRYAVQALFVGAD